MSALPHSTEALNISQHTDELPEAEEGTWLHVDFAQHGLGNRSCGPDVLPEYQLRATQVRFGFLLQSGSYTGAAVPDTCNGAYLPWQGEYACEHESYRDPSDPDQRQKVGLHP